MSLYGYKPKWEKALWYQNKAADEAIKRHSPPRSRKTRIRAVSKAKAADKRRYRLRVAVWLTEPNNLLCHACPKIYTWITGDQFEQAAPATQCHHKHGRGHNGELLLHEPLWIPVCAQCHNFIHNNPADARRVGLYAEEGKWNEL